MMRKIVWLCFLYSEVFSLNVGENLKAAYSGNSNAGNLTTYMYLCRKCEEDRLCIKKFFGLNVGFITVEGGDEFVFEDLRFEKENNEDREKVKLAEKMKVVWHAKIGFGGYKSGIFLGDKKPWLGIRYYSSGGKLPNNGYLYRSGGNESCLKESLQDNDKDEAISIRSMLSNALFRWKLREPLGLTEMLAKLKGAVRIKEVEGPLLDEKYNMLWNNCANFSAKIISTFVDIPGVSTSPNLRLSASGGGMGALGGGGAAYLAGASNPVIAAVTTGACVVGGMLGYVSPAHHNTPDSVVNIIFDMYKNRKEENDVLRTKYEEEREKSDVIRAEYMENANLLAEYKIRVMDNESFLKRNDWVDNKMKKMKGVYGKFMSRILWPTSVDILREYDKRREENDDLLEKCKKIEEKNRGLQKKHEEVCRQCFVLMEKLEEKKRKDKEFDFKVVAHDEEEARGVAYGAPYKKFQLIDLEDITRSDLDKVKMREVKTGSGCVRKIFLASDFNVETNKLSGAVLDESASSYLINKTVNITSNSTQKSNFTPESLGITFDQKEILYFSEGESSSVTIVGVESACHDSPSIGYCSDSDYTEDYYLTEEDLYGSEDEVNSLFENEIRPYLVDDVAE